MIEHQLVTDQAIDEYSCMNKTTSKIFFAWCYSLEHTEILSSNERKLLTDIMIASGSHLKQQ